MNDTDLTDRELELTKRTVDYCEFDDENMEIIVNSTDYDVTVLQRFDVTVSVENTPRGKPLLDVEVSEQGWATTWEDCQDAGEASEEAYKAARDYARQKTRTIFDSVETMYEHQSKN